MTKPFKYIKQGKISIITIQIFIFLFACSVMGYATGIDNVNHITGIVVDVNGDPLIGVKVSAQQHNGVGSITDSAGRFVLQLPSNNTSATLLFSYIGYQSQQVVARKDDFLHITLEEESARLNELVVVGYGVKRKGGLSAAVTTISSKEIARTTSTTTAGALVGKLPGITYRQKQGTPGSYANIQIRNMGTPLYVIDGILKDESSFNSIDINDIDNISVLKDGAAAIYGVKAANGVILITTKSGSSNQKPQVSINTYTGWQRWTKYPRLLNAYEWQYANYMKDINSGRSLDINLAKTELEKWHNGYYSPDTGDDYRGFDWQDAFVAKAAPQHYIHSNISGGSEKVNYYLSVSHVNQDAVFKDFNYNRSNLQANLTLQASARLKIGLQVGGKIENNTNPGLPGTDDYSLVKLSLLGLQPIYRPYANDNPQYINYIVANDARNMSALIKEHAGTFDQIKRVVQYNLNLDYNLPIKGLSSKGIFSYQNTDNQMNNNEKGWKEYTYDHTSDTYLVKYDKALAGDTYMVRERANTQDITMQTTLNYNRTFHAHQLNLLVGFEAFQRKHNLINITQHPITNPFIDLISSDENNAIYEIKQTQATASAVFRISYDYARKYVFDIAGRYDGSWKFPKNNRWGFFPTISGAWVISEEEFFKQLTRKGWFTNLKIRASYGEMGDDNLGDLYPDFAFQAGYNYNRGSAYMPNSPIEQSNNTFIIGSKPKGVPNMGLSWMKTTIADIGIDLGFFNNKLSAEFDLFRRRRNGIAAIPNDIQFPLESGLNTLPRNLNSDMNEGIDGFIKWNDNASGWRYFVGVNFTLARQKNGARHGELFYNALDKYYYSQHNRWANVSNGQVWMWETIGRFETQEEIDNYPINVDGKNNTTLLPGDLIFKDVNNDGLIDEADKRPLGYASVDWPWDSSKGNKNPLLTLGFNFGVEWKGIDLATDLAGAFMNTFVPDWYMKWGVSRSSNAYVYNSLNVWRHEDIFDPTSAWIAGDFPPLRDSNASTRNENNFYTKNVSYIRLRNLQIGYTLPKTWTQKAMLQKVRIYFQGTNLLCWDTLNIYGIDPETSTVNGTDYPQNKVWSFGFNITF